MTEVTCERCAELLGDYFEGRLPPVEHAAVDGHVSSCAACKDLWAWYQSIPEVVRRATDVSTTQEIRARLREFLAARTGFPRR